MKRKRNEWPVLKIREDGMPAIWLTHSLWTIIRQTLVREYCGRREDKGRHRARLAVKQPSELYDHPLAQCVVSDMRDAALRIYEIGSEAYFKPEHREEFNHLSPFDLIALGDKLELRAYDAEIKRLAPEPSPQLQAA